MIKSVVLPVVNGGTGAPAATDTLAGAKTIVASGVSGTIYVEASGDGVRYIQVATIKSTTVEQEIILVAPFMRVKATQGAAASVQVMAEEADTECVTIPVPPSNGFGAAVNVSQLGFLTSIFVANVVGSGAVSLQVSGDGINWATALQSCTPGSRVLFGGILTAKFVRARGQNASAGSIVVCSDSTLSDTLDAVSQASYIWQPGGTRKDNVYPIWADVYAKIQAHDWSLGVPELVIDASVSGMFDPAYGDVMAQIPAGNWDLSQVRLASVQTNIYQTLSFADGCNISIGTNHFPNAYALPIGIFFKGYRWNIMQISTVTTPFDNVQQGVLVFEGVINVMTGVGCKPLMKCGDDASGISCVGTDVSFNHPDWQFSGISPLAPSFDIAGHFSFAENPNFDDNVLVDSVGGGIWLYLAKTQQDMCGHYGGFEWANLGLTSASSVIRLPCSRPQMGMSGAVAADAALRSGHVQPVDATAAVELTLPSALFSFGEQVEVKVTTGASIVTITPLAGQTLEGAGASLDMDANVKASIRLVSDGAGNWMLMSGNLT